MSVNTADANRAVLLHSGEWILILCKETICEFSDNESPEFQGTKVGHTYLTSHRIVFRNRSEADLLSSISIPFVAMKNVRLRENSISGVVHPQSNGNFSDDVRFKLTFEKGGATEFIKALMIASWMAEQNEFPLEVPPYTPPTAWYEPGISTSRPPTGQFKWIPEHKAFTTPRPNSVYITNDPAPFPGINKHFCNPFGESPDLRSSSLYTVEESNQRVEGTYSFSPMDGVFPTLIMQHSQAPLKQISRRDQGV